ncbi:DUF1697 domain-containing protein [soil metagenome]
MPRFVAFLRAVNVGGRFVKMADLRAGLEREGLAEVSTHIQSGNVLFTSPARSTVKLEGRLEQSLASICGFTVDTMVRSAGELAQVVTSGNTLPDPFGGQARHMVGVLKTTPVETAQRELDDWGEPGVRGILIGRELHLFFQMKMLDSKLTGPKLARILGCPSTVREWRVLEAIAGLL